MEYKGRSSYSIRMDDGKTYEQEDVEAIITSFESLRDFTEKSMIDIEGEEGNGPWMLAEEGAPYGHPKHRSSIKVDEAIQFLDDCGTYEMAVFVALMFNTCLGRRLPDCLRRKLRDVVRRLASNRIVPPMNLTYYGKGSMNIGKIE